MFNGWTEGLLAGLQVINNIFLVRKTFMSLFAETAITQL